MKHTQRIKTILASLLVAAALSTPAVVLSTELPRYNAELYLEGAGLEVMDDGSVQAIFNVSVDRLPNCNTVEFFLFYNKDYLTPSYIAGDAGNSRNEEVLSGGGIKNTDGFFRVDEELYGKKDASGKLINPFQYSGKEYESGDRYYSYLNAGQTYLHMNLTLDRTRLGSRVVIDEEENETMVSGLGPAGKIKMLHGQTKDESEVFPVINRDDPEQDDGPVEKVVLGQISFRVNKEHMAEMVNLFQNFEDVKNAYITQPAKTFLLRFADETDGNKLPENDNPWAVFGYEGEESSASGNTPYGPTMHDDVHKYVADIYRFNFEGKTAVDVELANPKFTINAYQNYTNADEGDIALSLGRYSPIATVTYADGTRESFVVPWGQSVVSGILTGYDPGLGGLAYDPTGGHFFPSQKLILERDKTDLRGQRVLDGAGRPIRENYAFPVALIADMTVTPITLLDITAPDLERSYTVNQAVNDITAGDKLALPTQARLLTDIVPSGVSLVMPIPGWSPTQAASSWPVLAANGSNAYTLMNVLKGDSYTAEAGVPYWPENGDDLNAPEKYIDSYTFRKAESYGGALKPAYAEAEIDAAYPWLTTPDETEHPEIYRLEDAVRRIVGNNQQTDVSLYEARYVETTEPSGVDGHLKPTVTFEVKRKRDEMMLDTSVFRIWLPDGTELGTGLTTTGMAAADVEDWFHYDSGEQDENNQPIINQEGYYTSTEVVVTATNSNYWKLDVNTGDPTKPDPGVGETDARRQEREMQQANREKLRRYVNLGGWFNISVSEDPQNKTWSDPMPVYVEPRTNIYLESKEYNFLGENAELLRFPTPVANTVTLPHGSYTAVDEKGNPIYDNMGLPTLDGGSDGSAMNRPTLPRWREAYGLDILYDGQTGAQPGTLYKFTVDNGQKTPSAIPTAANSWWDTTVPQPQGRPDGATIGGANIFRYGAAPLYHRALYEAMGYVYQKDAADTDNLQTATLRREEGKEKERVWEEVILTSEEPSGITTTLDEHNHANVSLATYDTVMEGYQVRQDYTFTLTNVGTTTIYGLGIDGLTDGYPGEERGGRFEMLQPPADYLAPGQSTTFVLTYVYNLEANKKTDALSYRDTLYITSDNHPEGGKDKVRREDYLLDFDAELIVSDSPLHRVELLVYPNDGTHNPSIDDPNDPAYNNGPYPMGTADVIVGEQRTTPTTMDYTSATRSYPNGQTVYVLVEPKDEYRFDITCVNASNGSETILNYEELEPGDIANVLGDAKLAKGKKVYCFVMPDEDVTVTVRFWEDVFSKLRLTDLIDFSAGSADNLKITTEHAKLGEVTQRTVAPENTYKVWRKSFTEDELDDAETYSKRINGGAATTVGREDAQADLYLMTKGTAVPKNQGGQSFDPSWNHYIVVIPAGDKWDLSQVQATLRSIVVDRNGRLRDPAAENVPLGYLQENENIPVEVTMAWYSADCMDYHNSDGNADKSLETANDPNYHRTIYAPTGGFAKENDPANSGNRYIAEHVSNVFDSPAPGTSCYVRIRVQATTTEGVVTSTEYRHYYLEIHRAPLEPNATLNYGNSPFGMIMNAENIAAGQKDAAKDKFLKNYSFKGVDADHLPNAVKNNDNASMGSITYWREAWVKNRQVYEPESFTGQVQATRTITHDDGTTEVEYYMTDIESVYAAADNLDLSDEAYFAILGEDLHEPGLLSAEDSSGRPIDVTKVRVSATVTRLDTGETTQIKRFSGTETAVLDLGWAAQYTKSIAGTGSIPNDGKNYWPMSTATTTDGAGNTVATHTEVTDIRPGRYKMVYTYTDFDGESTLSVYRDFVILSPVGDVNVDLIRDCGGYDAGEENYHTSDEYVLKNRIRDPLGYETQIYTRTVTNAEGTQSTEEVYPYANIFKFRVCDVNNDRNINNVDGNRINKHVWESDESYDGFIRFYDPVNYRLW